MEVIRNLVPPSNRGKSPHCRICFDMCPYDVFVIDGQGISQDNYRDYDLSGDLRLFYGGLPGRTIETGFIYSI